MRSFSAIKAAIKTYRSVLYLKLFENIDQMPENAFKFSCCFIEMNRVKMYSEIFPGQAVYEVKIQMYFVLVVI